MRIWNGDYNENDDLNFDFDDVQKELWADSGWPKWDIPITLKKDQLSERYARFHKECLEYYATEKDEKNRAIWLARWVINNP